jgi:4a-hydroxytetrahydrobiopterin dehydratase
MDASIALEQNLSFKHCKPFKKGDRPLSAALVKGYLARMGGWKLSGKSIVKTFAFKDFYETIGFVNALAYIANREDHHPDLEVGYKTCQVSYSSHEWGGLSENDFICATKIDELLSGRS